MYLNNGYHAADEDEHDQVMLYPICSSEFCALHVKWEVLGRDFCNEEIVQGDVRNTVKNFQMIDLSRYKQLL